MKHLRTARKLALKSNYIFRLGAILIKGGSIHSTGWNTVDHPESPLYSEHAEESVLRKTSYKAKGATLLVVRIKRDGLMAMSYPCERCLNLIKQVGIKNLVFSNHAGEIETKRIRY